MLQKADGSKPVRAATQRRAVSPGHLAEILAPAVQSIGPSGALNRVAARIAEAEQ